MNPADIAALVIAPFVGSFLAVVVVRLPVGETIVSGRSRCRSCGATLAPISLLPVVSWLIQRGRCRHCDAPIGLLYPAIELAALGVALWAAAVVSGWLLWASCALGWTLITLAAIDFRTCTLPDPLTLPLIPAGLAVIAFVEPGRLAAHAIGAVAGFAAFAVIAAAYRAIRGREGLGLGDAKLMAAAGAWVGWQALPSVLLIGAAVALAYALASRVLDGPMAWAQQLAFGPHLALALWIVWLYGPLAVGG